MGAIQNFRDKVVKISAKIIKTEGFYTKILCFAGERENTRVEPKDWNRWRYFGLYNDNVHLSL